MSDTWQKRSAWHGVAKAGRHGRAEGAAGVRLAPRGTHAIATIIARAGQEAAVNAAIGIAAPNTPRVVHKDGASLVWAGPGQWLFVGTSRGAIDDLSKRLQGIAAVSDQSDARAMLRVSGPRARDALAKGCMIDLHPRAFAPGSTALTSIAHIGAQLWQVDDAPSYDIIVFRSMAGSFWHWLTDAAAEFGCEIVPASD